MDGTNKDFILSDSSITNTKGFKIDLNGGRFSRFDANPVMLYDHNTDLVIGRWENRAIIGGKMTATPVFDTADPIAAEKARKVNDGFLKGASIGVIPYQMAQIGNDYILTDWELLEASITPIPSDAGAIRLYDEKRQPITFEQFKLSINKHNTNNYKMDGKEEIKLSAETCKSLNLTGNYTPRDIEIAVAEKDKEIETLKADLKKEQDIKIDTYLSAALDAGKINAAQKVAYTELAQKDFTQVKTLIDAIELQPGTSLRNMQTHHTLAAGRETWNYFDWMQKDRAGLERLKHENPKEFERLQGTI